jgi:hypothetical protein
MSISPTLYARFFVRKFCAKLFCAYILGLIFFRRKNIEAKAAKMLVKLTPASKKVQVKKDLPQTSWFARAAVE